MPRPEISFWKSIRSIPAILLARLRVNAFLPKEGDHNFPQPVTLIEVIGLGEAVWKVEGNLHGDSLTLWVYSKLDFIQFKQRGRAG